MPRSLDHWARIAADLEARERAMRPRPPSRWALDRLADEALQGGRQVRRPEGGKRKRV